MSIDPLHIEQQLLELCRQRFPDVPALSTSTDLLAEGLLDSLLVLDLVLAAERRWGVQLDNADIAPRHFRDLRSLAARIHHVARHHRSTG